MQKEGVIKSLANEKFLVPEIVSFEKLEKSIAKEKEKKNEKFKKKLVKEEAKVDQGKKFLFNF